MEDKFFLDQESKMSGFEIVDCGSFVDLMKDGRVIASIHMKIKEDKTTDIDDYFMKICKIVSERATCPRKSVGCVVVKGNRIIATGYNGAPKGFNHCSQVGCMVKDNHCIRVMHAEMNALLFAGKEASDSTLYCTVLPCDLCMKMAVQAGVSRIVYCEDYNKQDILWILNEANIKVDKLVMK